MFSYVVVRDELGDAEQEVQELTRLLHEAQARRDLLAGEETAPAWLDRFLRLLGPQIKVD